MIFNTVMVNIQSSQELKKLIFEFRRIGNNLNQIARHFNTGGIHSQEMRKAIGQGLSDIFKMKEKVLKMAGDFQQVRKFSSTF